VRCQREIYILFIYLFFLLLRVELV
jgi:hypothetical protein